MTTGGSPADLSIGDVAERTGVGASTLRMWESRHGFPTAHRLPSGHRRYDETTVALVDDVLARRRRGVRLDVAIDEALAGPSPLGAPTSPSVFATLRRDHPATAVHRLRKSTLLGLSWSIEDEFSAAAPAAFLFGAFQHTRHFEAARDRWSDLAAVATAAYAFADFDAVVEGRPVEVPLPPEHPMQREWAIVADGSDVPVVLSAWEIPGQDDRADADRIFESLWSIDPVAVRGAARVCASVAGAYGAPVPPAVAQALARPATGPGPDARAVTALLTRSIAYLDTQTGAP